MDIMEQLMSEAQTAVAECAYEVPPIIQRMKRT